MQFLEKASLLQAMGFTTSHNIKTCWSCSLDRGWWPPDWLATHYLCHLDSIQIFGKQLQWIIRWRYLAVIGARRVQHYSTRHCRPPISICTLDSGYIFVPKGNAWAVLEFHRCVGVLPVTRVGYSHCYIIRRKLWMNVFRTEHFRTWPSHIDCKENTQCLAKRGFPPN